MALIYETENYKIDAADHPYVSREEGGHIYILPKFTVADRTKLTKPLAIEYMKLSMIVGEALHTVMAAQGIELGNINYQEMMNWQVFRPEGTQMHMHIYGRAKTAVKQKFGEAVLLPKRESGFYDSFTPLTDDDIAALKEAIVKLLNSEKYREYEE